jgi:twitching motility two-component system response regulator PilH
MRDHPLVLLADDNPDFKEIISAKLVAAGFEIAEASDGAEAITKAKALKPDLVVMDIDMPNVNGTEAVLEIKGTPESANVPIVFFSSLDKPWPGMAMEDKAQVAQNLGAVTFLKKSEELDVIVAKIKELVTPAH